MLKNIYKTILHRIQRKLLKMHHQIPSH